ncbi:non-SMC mitotic condensation complex subunit 1-domain-containing protein [Dunaliella salina]|uniref:Non-SMC mitotic condensation complex subunit 1-domain-containing protein n=1 Tax=Dunaliella salina TaxID=3046 RepID=A0ABQ7H5D5_DUNSA|nr:non-SMC mitotic condensation complex subunit 1-domain-containing protein [Dunaliella salina]|eukprot:KAF5842057.1 non-SMC mitotic condensation complex subunit 1-domain-containing protein [Dunaliella salina]
MQAFVDGSHGPGEEIAAPWSAICLGLLLQRCDDKAAAVRARALSNLAECLEVFRALLAASGGGAAAGNGGDDGHDDDHRDVRNVAEGFLLALCGGHILSSQVTQVPVVRRKAAAPHGNPSAPGTVHAGATKKKRGGRQPHKQARGGGGGARRSRREGAGAAESEEEGEGGSEEEQEEQLGGGEQAQGQQQQQGGGGGDGEEVAMVDEVVLVLPSRVRLDLGRLMTCAHRRVRDDKAPVRKAALSLLESALLLRGGLAAPVGQPPSLADITAVEAATADSLLSVRKAALAAASRLVAAFPEQIACCELWVRAALPLVRDAEVSIQEALLDQFSSLVLDKVAAAGTNKHGAEGAIRAVKPLLSALTLSSKGGAACAAKACSLLAQKHALHSKQVAACDASAPSWQFLRSAWAQLQAQGRAAAGEEGAQLLWVISHAASRFPAEDAAALAKELLQALLAFSLPPAAAAAHVAALHRLTTAAAAIAENGSGHPQPSGKGAKGRGSGKNAAGAPSQWGSRVLEAAHEVLVKAVERRGTELQRSPSPVVRNNCLVALADMCIHYTAMVDGYLPRLAGLIRDPHELVRRQALALLANLLMKDYVKWRGALFHRFALALVDTSPAVRNLAEYLLGDTLAVKAPLLAYNHFVEALFMLNGCQAGLHAGRIGGGGGGGSSQPQPSQQQQQQPGVEAGSDLYSLKGSTPGIRAQRDTIYFTLLRRMSPEHKFATQAKLVAEVLGAVADGLLPLHEAGAEEVLGDALRLLGSKEIKVSASRMVAGDEDALMASGVMGGEGATQAVAEVAKAKGKLVSAMMKKHLVESVIPLLIELKHMLQEARHPMLGQLMTCMAAMLKDYKAEIEDILVTDKQLAKELLFDMKQAEQAAKQQQQQQACAARRAAGMPPTPLHRSPHHTHQQQQHPGGRTPGTHVGGPIGDGPASASHTPARAAQVAGAAQGEGSTQQAGQEGVPLQPAQPAARTPGAKLLAARRATPGGASRRSSAATPYSTRRDSIGGGAAPGMVLSAAPLSAAKTAHARSRLAVVQQGGDSDDSSDFGDGEGARVQLPGVTNEPQVQRQWNVKLGEQAEEGKGGRGKAKPDPGKGKGTKAGGGRGRQWQVQQQTTEEVVRAVADLAATSECGQLEDGSQQQRQHVQDEHGEGGGPAAAGSRKQLQGSKSARSKAGPSEKSVKVKEEPEEGDNSIAVQGKSARSPSAGRKRRKN